MYETSNDGSTEAEKPWSGKYPPLSLWWVEISDLTHALWSVHLSDSWLSPSFEQPSYILVNSSILSPISPGKEFGPPFQSPLQPGIRHGTWSSSIRCIPMNLLFRSEQGEETSFFFFFETWHFVGAEPCKSVWHLKVAAIPQWWQQWQQFPPVQGGVGVAIPVMVISSSGQFFSMVLTFILGSLAWSHFSSPPQNSLSYAVSL